MDHKALTENPSSELEMEEVVKAVAGITANTDAARNVTGMGATRAEFTEKNDTAIDIENPHNKVMNDIREGIRNLSPPPSKEICIYHVPENIRKLDEEAYTPLVVSIGPYHHGNKNFLFMENCKWIYFQAFIQQSGVSLERYVELMKKNEVKARACYAGTIDMTSDEFVTTMLIDGYFIIELVRQSYNGDCLVTQVNEFIFSKNWLITRIRHDLILLENQIPFFILESIYNLAVPSPDSNDQLRESILQFFKSKNNQNKSPDFRKVMHFTDLIREFYLPESPDFMSQYYWPPADSDSEIKFEYTATQLHEAGVKLKKGSSNCLLDVEFTGGVLEFPHLTLQDETKYVIRNLMALEVCHYSHATPIIDYIVFLDSLIDTPNDVRLLAKNEMLYNGVGSTSAAADIVNKLCTEVTYYSKKSYLIPLCKDLKAYYNLPMNRWRAALKRDYFNTPWRTVATTGAIMLLLLTLVQSIFSVLSFPHGIAG